VNVRGSPSAFFAALRAAICATVPKQGAPKRQILKKEEEEEEENSVGGFYVGRRFFCLFCFASF
jgi:hypothetical protein